MEDLGIDYLKARVGHLISAYAFYNSDVIGILGYCSSYSAFYIFSNNPTHGAEPKDNNLKGFSSSWGLGNDEAHHHINKIYEKPKFNIGDKVKIVESGMGCNSSTIGEIVTITDIGLRHNETIGYKIDNLTLNTNSKTGSDNGLISECSFELATSLLYKPYVRYPLGRGVIEIKEYDIDSYILWDTFYSNEKTKYKCFKNIEYTEGVYFNEQNGYMGSLEAMVKFYAKLQEQYLNYDFEKHQIEFFQHEAYIQFNQSTKDKLDALGIYSDATYETYEEVVEYLSSWFTFNSTTSIPKIFNNKVKTSLQDIPVLEYKVTKRKTNKFLIL